MWTIISWNRETKQWYALRGYDREETAFETAKLWVKDSPPTVVHSLADSAGEIVWAGIGTHPVVGHCEDPVRCWCGEFDNERDHTLPEGSSNT